MSENYNIHSIIKNATTKNNFTKIKLNEFDYNPDKRNKSINKNANNEYINKILMNYFSKTSNNSPRLLQSKSQNKINHN